MIDLDHSIYPRIVTALGAGKYEYLTPPMAFAVTLEETSGVPIFQPTDSLYHANLVSGMRTTTLPAALIRDAMLIKGGPYEGQIAKFRLEPAYWSWTAKLRLASVTERILCSCSFGVGQKMMRWMLPTNRDRWLIVIEDFKGNVDQQIRQLAVDLEILLQITHGDLQGAYKGYNSGNTASQDPNVVMRAQHVVALAAEIKKQLGG